jgi:hypothetical protein
MVAWAVRSFSVASMPLTLPDGSSLYLAAESAERVSVALRLRAAGPLAAVVSSQMRLIHEATCTQIFQISLRMLAVFAAHATLINDVFLPVHDQCIPLLQSASRMCQSCVLVLLLLLLLLPYYHYYYYYY